MARRSETTGDIEKVFVEEDGYERKCAGIVLPERMTFKDDQGEEHNIFLDVGSHEEAYAHAEKRDWEALKKFPRYIGQKHKRSVDTPEKREEESKQCSSS